eukprot:7813268-Alexandrium_andersonii.AAC.1
MPSPRSSTRHSHAVDHVSDIGRSDSRPAPRQKRARSGGEGYSASASAAAAQVKAGLSPRQTGPFRGLARGSGAVARGVRVSRGAWLASHAPVAVAHSRERSVRAARARSQAIPASSACKRRARGWWDCLRKAGDHRGSGTYAVT